MDIFWLMIMMVVYGFIIGLIIGVGAFCYAFISIQFETGGVKGKGKSGFALPAGLSKQKEQSVSNAG